MENNLFEGLFLIETKTFADDRGYFRETYRQKSLEELLGRKVNFIQDNESCSKAGVIRGLHFQREPHAQAKLVRIAYGKIFDVAVDIRPNSPTFGQWRGFELSAENGKALFIPEGMAHGFCALTDNTVVNYRVNAYYAPESDGGLLWNDPTINVQWPKDLTPIVSDKDQQLPTWEQWVKK